MKRRTWLMALLLTVGSLAQVARATDVAPDSEGMNLTAQQWAKEVVMGWNLGNALECPTSETEWGNPKTTQAMIKAVRQAGFNAIRIPVRWGGHLTDATAMTIDAAWIARVKEVVDWSLAEGMYVIINDHHEDWYDRNPYYNKQAENNRKLAALWQQVATAFRDYGERLAFGGTNETTVNWSAPNAEQQAVQNSYNQTFVDAVRATGGKNYYRNLIVQTFACSPYHGLSGFTIPEDQVEGHLSVEFHYYDPYEYCGSCQYYYWGNAYKDKGKILTSSTEQTITNLFDRIRNTWGTKGLGIVMGEYGVANHYTEDDKQTQQENMQYYLKCVVSEARAHGFAAFVWDNNAFNNGSENFGIFKRWQNMAVGNTYFLRGITEGAGTDYVEPSQPDDPATGEGVTFWEGDAVLDWGNGLQLAVPASLFEGKSADRTQLLLSYVQDYTDYDQLQIFYGDWSEMAPFTVGGSEYSDGKFSPSNHYATGTGTEHTTPFMFGTAAFATVQQKGLVLQGHGLRLTKVAIATLAETDIREIEDLRLKVEDLTAGGAAVYDLQGRRVNLKSPTSSARSFLQVGETSNLKSGIYIIGGRKVVR